MQTGLNSKNSIRMSPLVLIEGTRMKFLAGPVGFEPTTLGFPRSLEA